MIDSLLSRVLVPLDGSPNAELILQQLRRFLPRHESMLTLLQVLPFNPEQSVEEVEEYLRRMAFELTEEGFPAKIALRHGSAAGGILEVAATEQSTLIALATHGRSGFDRWIMGSVSELVLRASPVPILLARTYAPTYFRGRPASVPVRNILLPLDGSPESLEALEPVFALARGTDAHVRILRVMEAVEPAAHWESPDEFMKRADQILREACIPTTIEHRRGKAAEEILKCSREHHHDLIAMTTHGRSGPPLWMLGSVAVEVLRGSAVPLLVVRRSATSRFRPAPLVEVQKTAGNPEFPASSPPMRDVS